MSQNNKAVMLNQSTGNSFAIRLALLIVWIIFIYIKCVQPFYQVYNILLPLGLGMAFFLAVEFYASNTPFVAVIPKAGWVMLIYLLYSIISGVFTSPSVALHLSQSSTCFQYTGIMFAVIIISHYRNSFDSFVWLILTLGLFYCVMVIATPTYGYGYAYSHFLGSSSYINPNAVGMTLCFGLWALLYFISLNRINRAILLVLLPGFIYCIVMTGSRKSFIAAAIIIITWLVLCYYPTIKGKINAKKLFQFVIVLIFIAWFIAWLASVFADSILAMRITLLQYEITEGARAEMFRHGYALFFQNPLFGIGYSGFEYYYGTYSHATLVEVPLSGGIVGTLIYVYAYGLSIAKLLRLRKQIGSDIKQREWMLGLNCLLILWLVILFFTVCIIHVYELASLFVMGILLVGAEVIERRMNNNEIASGCSKM